MNLPRDVAHLSTQELRDLTTALIAQLSAKDEQLTAKDEELKFKQLKIDQLTHEMATLKRWRFGRRSEQLDPSQRSLLEESIDEDLEAISRELEALRGKRTREERPKDKPRRTALPSHLPRREVRHEPENTVCSCGCQLERIGEDVSEKLDYTPGTFQVERHVRGKWVCRSCETLIQAPVPPQVIDKGIPTAGLLAHVLVSKFAECRYRHSQYHAASGTMPQNSVGGRKRPGGTRFTAWTVRHSLPIQIREADVVLFVRWNAGKEKYRCARLKAL